MKITRDTKKILAPLSNHRSQLLRKTNKCLGRPPAIGYGFSSDPKTSTISHADFVAGAVLPVLARACDRFSQEEVARQIIEITLPLYKYQRSDEVASFLSSTLCDGNETGNISSNVTNSVLAEKYGVDYVFRPISELGIVHMTTRVFSPSKFFHHHACRMGEVIDNFSQADYLDYIELCKALLQNGIFDWGMENYPEQWGMLRPSIRLYGLLAVMKPMVQAMVDIGHLPGTKELKYQFSLMHQTIQGLYPIMLPKVRTIGVEEVDKLLRPIVDFVLDLSKEGAFMTDMAHNTSVEGLFFRSLAEDYVDDIRKKGIHQVLKEIRLPWLKKLMRRTPDLVS